MRMMWKVLRVGVFITHWKEILVKIKKQHTYEKCQTSNAKSEFI